MIPVSRLRLQSPNFSSNQLKRSLTQTRNWMLGAERNSPDHYVWVGCNRVALPLLPPLRVRLLATRCARQPPYWWRLDTLTPHLTIPITRGSRQASNHDYGPPSELDCTSAITARVVANRGSSSFIKGLDWLAN